MNQPLRLVSICEIRGRLRCGATSIDLTGAFGKRRRAVIPSHGGHETCVKRKKFLPGRPRRAGGTRVWSAGRWPATAGRSACSPECEASAPILPDPRRRFSSLSLFRAPLLAGPSTPFPCSHAHSALRTPPSPAPTQPMTAHRIDTHHHPYPPPYIRVVGDRLKQTTHAFYPRLVS